MAGEMLAVAAPARRVVAAFEWLAAVRPARICLRVTDSGYNPCAGVELPGVRALRIHPRENSSHTSPQGGR